MMTKLTHEDIAISIEVQSLSDKFTTQNVVFFCLFVCLREIEKVVFTTMYKGNQDNVIIYGPPTDIGKRKSIETIPCRVLMRGATRFPKLSQ